ncbi:unnamed protein product [Ceutorhynchus assimilis]|uniref:Microtubule-associated protein Jupiter n=1 Tax=Ceutorhynchus assimilis TaxID=467358 RepID=A0A9N9MDG0_9CUCU|nr:unnamed protein product [Ceutorhynchus assimilis]
MANVYVGFHDQRNSSRVLKPPGGGTSSIFNNDFIPDVVPKTTPVKDNAKYKTSSIQDVLQTSTKTTTTSSTTTTTNNEVNESTPDITCQVEQMKIVESSTKSEVTETDSSGNEKVIASDSKSDGSVEHSFKKGASIGDILNQDDIMEKKKVKGSPGHQRVPPGGYSSGLW